MSKVVDKTVYISIDVETDGPCPGVNSMLSLGAVAMDSTGFIKGRFEVNLEPLIGSTPDPKTMDWWATQLDAWHYATSNRSIVTPAMNDFVNWVDRMSPRPVCIAYPAGFDFTFVYWYMMKFVGRSPFGFSCLDIKTYASAILGTTYRKSVKKRFPDHWFDKNLKHSHKAVEDAEEQARMFHKMRVDASEMAMFAREHRRTG